MLFLIDFFVFLNYEPLKNIENYLYQNIQTILHVLNKNKTIMQEEVK